MIDIHSHILPGIDDGAKDMECSINMLKHAVENGTNAIIATPHYYRNNFEVEYNRVIEELEKLRAAAYRHNIDIDIYSGQEVFADISVIELYKRGIINGLCGTNYMLIEFNMFKYSKEYLDIIYEIGLLGVTPVIAHPERYLYIIENIELINNFIAEGCLLQLDSGSITGTFGKRVEKTARNIIESGAYHFLGSDAHSTGIRNTGLSHSMETIKKINSYEANIMERNSQLLIMNEYIPSDGNKVVQKKSLFSIFKKG
ncbi:MAG: tyrosine-protein phosphatase [Solirubrobacterales bacterium]